MTDTAIYALGATAVVVIAALTKGAVEIIKTLRETKQVVVAAAQLTTVQNEIADAKLNKVIQLVDGPLGAALIKIASRDATISDLRGTAVDVARAEESKATAEAHQASAREVIASTDALAAATEARKLRREP